MDFVIKLSSLSLPLILLLFAMLLFFSKEDYMESFAVGAKEGMINCINLFPTLLLIMCGVSMLFSSGAVDVLCRVFSGALTFFGVPKEMLPSIILRPFSGSGVTAVSDRLFRQCGPDSLVSRIACLLMGSTDTIIYTLGVYFSAAGIKKTRHALASSLIVFLFSIVFCTFVGNAVFS